MALRFIHFMGAFSAWRIKRGERRLIGMFSAEQ
jgi:hypothetical protein